MKLVLSRDSDERMADLFSIGALAGALHLAKSNEPLIRRWLDLLLKVNDDLAKNPSANEFELSFRPAVRASVKRK